MPQIQFLSIYLYNQCFLDKASLTLNRKFSLYKKNANFNKC